MLSFSYIDVTFNSGDPLSFSFRFGPGKHPGHALDCIPTTLVATYHPAADSRHPRAQAAVRDRPAHVYQKHIIKSPKYFTRVGISLEW
jgi:hypothetical protein